MWEAMYSPDTEGPCRHLQHVLHRIVYPGHLTHNLRLGSKVLQTSEHTYITQISTPHCTTICLTSRSAKSYNINVPPWRTTGEWCRMVELEEGLRSSGRRLVSISLMPESTNFFPKPIMAPMALEDPCIRSGSCAYWDIGISSTGRMNSMRRHLEVYLQYSQEQYLVMYAT